MRLLTNSRGLDGLEYHAEFISREFERELIQHVRRLEFRAFEFHGYRGKRRVVSFGWRYDFTEARLMPAAAIPEFLHPLRKLAASVCGVSAAALSHALVTEYSPGAGIGWHKDRFVFDLVIGVSLLAACRLRFRRRSAATWQRASMIVEPRSAYILRGPARTEWEHSIAPMEAMRYSVTFRSLQAELCG